MDGLCELTSRLNRRKPNYDIPDPDYELDHGSDGIANHYSANMERDEDYECEDTSLTPEQIRKSMSKEQIELQKDLKIMHRRGNDFQSKRPEFKSKHHEIMSKGAIRKESQQNEQSELSAKLKSRSDVIKQADEAKKLEDCKPEFMKVQLKKGKGSQNP